MQSIQPTTLHVDIIRQHILRLNTQLAAVLLTHSHSDHIKLATTVADESGCAIYMSAVE